MTFVLNKCRQILAKFAYAARIAVNKLRPAANTRYNLRKNSGECMSLYIYELEDWPRFYWDYERIGESLPAARYAQGRLVGRIEALGFHLRQEAVLETLTADVVMSSDIEGEKLDTQQVRSSIARRLGIDIGALKATDRAVEGVVEMMLDATGHYDRALTADRLFDWHGSLFPSGRSGMHKIRVAAWRDDANGPMQVVSGPLGRELVHFEAPAAARLDSEMQAFLDWFNTDLEVDPVLKAGLAHLWFVTIHPFDDGNGRIARAIADMALARSERSPRRFYSMSAQIREEREAYYRILEQTEKGTMDVTHWMDWFLRCLGRAIDGAESLLGAVLSKAGFWERIRDVPLNDRQRAVLNRLLDGLEGKLTTTKYAKLAKCSQDTALRDMTQLLELGILVRGPQGGRSTSYQLSSRPKKSLRSGFIKREIML